MGRRRRGGGGAQGRFLVPLSECEFQISNVLEELHPDAFPALAAHRASRCTGIALIRLLVANVHVLEVRPAAIASEVEN